MTAVLERKWLASSLFTLLLLAVWQLAGALGLLPAYVLTPTAIAAALGTTVTDGTLLPASASSLSRQMSGFLLGSSAGVALGLLAGVSRWAEDVFDTLVSLTYPLPKIALFPVVVIWLGYTDAARILVIAISCFYPSFINAFAGTRGIEPRLLWVARNAGAGRLRAFRQVVLRAAMPAVVNGVRLSLALSFILTFATESLGASRGGLGALIEDGFNDLVYPLMWAGIVAFALYGFLADQAWTRLAGQLLRGQRVEAVGRG
ncbi:ABC transporter permease [Geodermatophilus sp. DSM 44513]|uniref:ABC transporter permease n=1 Tax=Geodermatophilus sp. DSM 44513 TaxID=1528104 RepID=UPI0014133B8A|nr:ABC transporter permease [Geodermatophilus sp. DSM 44513]WNV77097.1 ABC transporter permease [Geodermatophilus sp. DSM 44513]